MRRYTGHMNGERYLGNVHHMHVHDLDNEKGDCEIDKIMRAGDDRPFNDLATAGAQGYRKCKHCL
jgi:hypothetical protein